MISMLTAEQYSCGCVRKQMQVFSAPSCGITPVPNGECRERAGGDIVGRAQYKCEWQLPELCAATAAAKVGDVSGTADTILYTHTHTTNTTNTV